MAEVKVTATRVTTWERVLNAARTTVGKSELHKEPSDEFKENLILSEHSPLRLLEYDIKIEGVRQWVTTHLVRHHIGCEKFVHSQREDRDNRYEGSRDELPQGALNDMVMTCNAQALINISKVRLCRQASKETREVWEKVKLAIDDVEPILASKMVPSCVYRGFCPEINSCGYTKTQAFEIAVAKYRGGKQ